MLDFTKFSVTELENMLKDREQEVYQMTFNPELLVNLQEIEEIKKVIQEKKK